MKNFNYLLLVPILFALACNTNKKEESFNPNHVKFSLENRKKTIPESVKNQLEPNYYSSEEPLYFEISFWGDTTQTIKTDSVHIVFFDYETYSYLDTITLTNTKGKKSISKAITMNIGDSEKEQLRLELFFDTTFVTKRDIVYFNYPLYKRKNTASHNKIINVFKENEAVFDDVLLEKYAFIHGTVEKIIKYEDTYAIHFEDEYVFTDFIYIMNENVDLTRVQPGQDLLIYGKCVRPNKYDSYNGNNIAFLYCDIINES
ncbi:hypothetical protein [Anaerophaga thermohalophila]|uniref:hypothetical protein n=1 Tax=Anaerophaga thermohalophila TaxID=177400 RepID=UPI000237D5F9|nr:hypothetical protein [Anaerophaga thermohalophila]